MASPATDPAIAGRRVALVGRLAGMPRREAQQLVREHGGVLVERPDAGVDLIVVGERQLPAVDEAIAKIADGTLRSRIDNGQTHVITETQLWQRLGLVDDEQSVRRLYTPAMLAHLLRVPVAEVRRWHRRGWIRPTREVRRLPYFDFQEVATARLLAELLNAGASPGAIEKRLVSLGKHMPGVDRPLAELGVVVEGRQILLRQGDGLVEPGGQLRLDFEAHSDEGEPATHSIAALVQAPVSAIDVSLFASAAASPDMLLQSAIELEDSGQTEMAAEMYRALLAAAGPSPEVNFRLAELLYQLNDLSAARERYYMAIELDEDYVEARANLGCVLAELGQEELAVAAFEGALAYHHDYADVHYHLARLLDKLAQADRAAQHWRAFLLLSPDSPWADEAIERLEAE